MIDFKNKNNFPNEFELSINSEILDKKKQLIKKKIIKKSDNSFEKKSLNENICNHYLVIKIT